MPATTSRRPARYSEEFGKGILPEHDAFPFGVIASSHGPGVPPSVIMDHIFAKEKAEADAKRLASLPPLSGGSDAATAEVEVHHGDDYCPECGEFHERDEFEPAPPASSRPIHPIAYWLALDVRTLGPDARREFEFWYLEGYAVGRDDREMEDQPPACLDSFQLAAWCRGYRAGANTLSEELRRVVDVEMEVCGG